MQSVTPVGGRRRDQPFAGLGVWIRESGFGEALRFPVAPLIGQPTGPGSGVASLRQLSTLFRDLTVAHLIEPPPALRPLIEWRTEQDWQSMERELQRAIRRRFKAPPAATPQALVALARERGLTHLLEKLTESVGVRLPQLEPGKPNAIGLALESKLIPANLAEPMVQFLQDALLDEEEDRLSAEAEERELRALNSSSPLGGSAGDLETSLLAAWQFLPRGSRVGPNRRLVTRIGAIPGRTLQLSLALSGVWGDTGVRGVSINFQEWPGRILFSCECGINGGCIHMREAVAIAVRHLRSPQGPAAAYELATPGWEKVLSLAQGAVEEPRERVLWRVWHDANLLPLVEGAIQKRRNRGWTAGRAARPGEIGQLPGLEARDRRIAEALDAVAASPAPRPGLATALVEWLEGHPQAIFLFTGAEVAVRRARVELVVEASPAGFEIIPTLDGDGTTWELLRQVSSDQRVLVDSSRSQVVLFEMSPRVEKLLQSLRDHGTRFDRSSRERMMALLDALEDEVPLRLAPALLGVAAQASDSIHLRLDFSHDGLDVQVRVRPLAGSAPELPGQGPNPVSRFVLEAGKRLFAQRNLDAEIDRARSIASRLGLPANLEQEDWTARLSGDASLDLVVTLQKQIIEHLVVEWPPQRLRVTGEVKTSALRMQVKEGRDWFNLTGSLEIGGDQVELSAILKAMKDGRRYLAIGPDRWASLETALRSRLSRLAEAARPDAHSSQIEIGPASAPIVDELAGEAAEVEATPGWLSVVSRLRASREIDPVPPEHLRAALRPYQVEGFAWLMRLAEWGVGGVLADDMGLGKTVQALAVLVARGTLGPALVIAPTSVCFNWIREAEKFAPGLRVTSYRDAQRESLLGSLQAGDLVVASYGLVARDAERFASTRFATLVLDEAHAVKNPSTRRTAAVRSIPADWRMALTGTPLENHLGELWSLFAVVSPGLLGGWEGFRERYLNPIEVAKDRVKLAALARLLRPFILRRTKDQVARDLPARTEILKEIVLGSEERRLYEAARMDAVVHLGAEAIDEGPQGRFKVLAAITRLRQLACHPRLVVPESKVASSKMTAVLDLLLELREEGHRALVFSQFVEHLALVKEELVRAGFHHLYLDGSTPERVRVERVEAFQRGEGDAFLISLKAGGSGLNLTGADYVLHLDPWWNPAVEDQATDRAHRIGQTRPVTAYGMVSKGTIEEAILALHAEKRELMAGILEGASAPGKLSARELLDLIQTGAAESAVGEEEDS